MPPEMRELFIVDVEATCWPNDHERAGQPQEIIEIGYVLLSLGPDLESLTEGGIFVKPTYSTISSFCEQLTGIGPMHVANAPSFKEACERLRGELSTHRIAWASWGDFDRTLFTGQCADEKVRYPFSRTHFNLKALYAIAQNRRKQCGLGAALKEQGMGFIGQQHRGVDDAKNIARVARKMLADMREKVRMPDDEEEVA